MFLKTTFTPSTPAAIEIAVIKHDQIIEQQPEIDALLLQQCSSYYMSVLLWMRFVSLKVKNQQPINSDEIELLKMIETTNFNVPQPMLMQLQQVGNELTPTGQSLYPKFPPLSSEVIQDKPGFFGQLLSPGEEGADDNLHNLYEELPCIGVLAEAIQVAVMDDEPGEYETVLTYEGRQPNANLLGFRPRRLRDPQAYHIVTDAGIDAENFPNYPMDTGINIELMQSISDIMSRVTCFKDVSRNVFFFFFIFRAFICRIYR